MKMHTEEQAEVDMEAECESGVERDFHHPYTPYHIQSTFMNTVYEVLERGDGGVGILESPTGTGKSLSLICGTLTWLRDHKRRTLEEGLDWTAGADADADDPDWIVEQARVRRRRELLRSREEIEERLEKVRRREKLMNKGLERGQGKRRKVEESPDGDKNEDRNEEEFLLDDWESDREELTKGRVESSGLSAETMALMEKMGMTVPGAGRKRVDEDEDEDEVKIYYCSRTHSQLTQFINELRRVHIPSALPPAVPVNQHNTEVELEMRTEPFRHATLGSRKNLCIHTAVSKLSSASAINERCLDLQTPSTPSAQKCPYIPNATNQGLVHEFRDHALARILDIEDLPPLGKEIGICPYYASRSVIRSSEIVTLPYPLLLQKSAREALGIKLEGNVVVIDEAHNVMDAVAGIYGVEVSLEQLKKAGLQVRGYAKRFGTRLKGGNRVYIAQMLRVLESLCVGLEGRVAGGNHIDGTIEPTELLKGKGVDQINIYKLLKYLQESKLARKVEGYIQYSELSSSTSINDRRSYIKSNTKSTTQTPTLQHVAALLTALTNPSKEGRLFYSHSGQTNNTPATTTLKYLLLDPTHHFAEIVSSARAVILAGGTMSPMSDYTSHLLSYLPPSKITTLSCGHVIPKENLLAWTLSKGPSGQNFEFTYSKRQGLQGEEMLDELGRALLNICTVVPDGVVVFFPSYAFLETAVVRWSIASVAGDSLWTRLGVKKSLFRESKEAKGGAEDVLSAYAAAIDMGKGGLLLSVVGGKMSEGINFSDSLGRCVVIVGLPFPNAQSAEWKAKMRYIEEATGTPGGSADGKTAAREFYENACMRAVNQSVGRAIRHREDFAAIVMVDIRFGGERVKGKLPGWIKGGITEGCEKKGFGELMGALGAFFRRRRK